MALRRWSAEEIARALGMKARGVKVPAIAAELRAGVGAVRALFENLKARSLRVEAVAARGPAKQRRCLSCRRPFPSAGRHDQVCEACEALPAWGDGQDCSLALPARSRKGSK